MLPISTISNEKLARLHPAFSEAARLRLKVAALSFGRPAGQIAVMHRILFEEKRWVSESRFPHALREPQDTKISTSSGPIKNRCS